MSSDVSSWSGSVATSTRVHRRRGVVLVVIALFQFWLWGTRIVNLLRDAESATTAFVGVHLALYVAAVGVGVVLLVLGVRMLREARGSGS